MCSCKKWGMSDPHMSACTHGSIKSLEWALVALYKHAPALPTWLCRKGLAGDLLVFFSVGLPTAISGSHRAGRSRHTLESPGSLLVLTHAPVSHVSSPACFCARATAASSSGIAIGLYVSMASIGRTRLRWPLPPSLGMHGRTKACQTTPHSRIRCCGGIVVIDAAGAGRMPQISASICIPGGAMRTAFARP